MKTLFTIANKCRVTFEAENGEMRTNEFSNITCVAWRAELARRIIDNITPDIWVAKYIAVGDDSTPATENDTHLTNEVRREAIREDLSSRIDNVVKVYARYARGYVLSVHEAGLFIGPDATDINGTGSLLCHSVFDTPLEKSTQEIMTIEWTVSIVNHII
jgi:hypothetical protein